MLTDLADAARKSGLRVVEVPGWRTRGRPARTGSFNPHGVLCHHTGGADNGRHYADWLAKVGRSDLPAPLAHLSLDRDGVVYVLAAGRANHAGVAKASGPMPAGDGNTLYVGIEAQNTGSEGWDHKGTDASGNPVTQREAYVALCAALSLHYGWPASHVRAHKETSVTGKWDPGHLAMGPFRDDVAHLMAAGLEDDVDLMELMRHNLTSKDGELTVAAALRDARDANVRAARIENAVQALAKALGPTVESAVQAALADAVVNVDVNVNNGEDK